MMRLMKMVLILMMYTDNNQDGIDYETDDNQDGINDATDDNEGGIY